MIMAYPRCPLRTQNTIVKMSKSILIPCEEYSKIKNY